jgi:hypothetical protein
MGHSSDNRSAKLNTKRQSVGLCFFNFPCVQSGTMTVSTNARQVMKRTLARSGAAALLLLVALVVLAACFHEDPTTTTPMPDFALRTLSEEPRILQRDGNVYSLMRGAWDFLPSPGEEAPAPSAPSASRECFQPIWDFQRHDCCPVSDQQPKLHPNLAAFETSRLLEMWRNKNVVFVGDSITQQLMNSLMRNVHAEGRYQNVDIRSERTETTVELGDYNATLRRVGDGGGISHVHEEHMPGTFFDTPGRFEEAVRSSDIAYINFGLHLCDLSSSQLDTTFSYVRNVLEGELAAHPHKRFFYRTTFPQHFERPDGTGGDYVGRASDACVAPGVETSEHPTSQKAREAFRGSAVAVLDGTDFLAPRADLHSLHNPNDCSHWCWDHEMWRGIFYLLAVAFEEQ